MPIYRVCKTKQNPNPNWVAGVELAQERGSISRAYHAFPLCSTILNCISGYSIKLCSLTIVLRIKPME